MTCIIKTCSLLNIVFIASVRLSNKIVCYDITKSLYLSGLLLMHILRPWDELINTSAGK